MQSFPWEILNANGGGYKGRYISEEDGYIYEFVDYRDKDVLTALERVIVKRAYYYDNKSGKGVCPKNTALNIEGTSYSPGVRRMMSKVGAYRSFGLWHEDLHELAGIRVNAKEVELVGRQIETFHAAQGEVDRQGKAEDGQAKTRDAKLGCVFTQTNVDKEGWPVRNESSTSYTGAIEIAEYSGWRIYKEAKRRGTYRAKEVCVLGDGARWIWNSADEHFSGAQQIVDLYHAREHYWKVARACSGLNKEKLHQWAGDRRMELDAGKSEDVIAALKQLSYLAGYDKEICEREIGYFEKKKNGCVMPISENAGSLSAPECWRLGAKQLSAND